MVAQLVCFQRFFFCKLDSEYFFLFRSLNNINISIVFFPLMESRRLRNIKCFVIICFWLALLKVTCTRFHEARILIIEPINLKRLFFFLQPVFPFSSALLQLRSVFTIIIKWINVSWQSNIHLSKIGQTRHLNSIETTRCLVWIKRWGLPPHYQKVQYINFLKITNMIYFILWSKSESMSDCIPAVDRL